ncbi:hypothetical protein BH23GEM11_BH23GEM11_07860 [soil metagenome]
MLRRRLLPMLSLVLVALVAGCDSSTDVTDASAQGDWDGVGALEASFSGVRLALDESSGGTITGTWRTRAGQVGSASGVNQNGQITLELTNFEVGTVVFQGSFSNRYRLEGELQGATLGGPAVFRRVRF